MEISIIIPTKDREKDLFECIESLIRQTVKPKEVLIIDDGQMSETTKLKTVNSFLNINIPFRYIKKIKPGLSNSKNLGAKEAIGDIVLFLDDDVVLDDGYIENLLRAWQKKWNDKKLAGIGGLIKNSRKISFLENIYNKLFFLYSKRPWVILPWGYQTWHFNFRDDVTVDWILGCDSSFRKEIFNDYKFRNFQSDRTASEDLELCWQLKNKGYYFIITPFAKLIHKVTLASREGDFLTGIKEGSNRKIMFNMHVKKNMNNYFCFCVASFGIIGRQFISGHFSKACGMIKGYLKN